MNKADSNSDINNFCSEVQTDYVSYNSLYNEVLDKVKKGLEKQRSNSSINKKNLKKQNSENNSKSINPNDIALFDDDDSDDSDSEDFLEWENSDNDTLYNSKFKGGLARAKSHINELNDDNDEKCDNNNSNENNIDIIKDRIVLNKHFQKIYGFNDSSFRHGDYEFYNNMNDNFEENDDNNSSDNELNSENIESKEEKGPITEEITDISTDQATSEQITNVSNDDLEKQFYNELHRASMIIDLQQHYRLRDVLKNKEDLKQEIVEGYNALHNEKYSSEDLPDFQNLENILEVKAKIINNDNDNDNDNDKNENNQLKSEISILDDVNKATENKDINDSLINNDQNNNNEKEADDQNENKLVNDTWKFLFNNPYSLQFLSKSLKSSNDKLSTNIPLTDNISAENNEKIIEKEETNTPLTDNISTENNEIINEKEELNTEKETVSNDNPNLELNNELLSKILKKNIKNEEKLKNNEEENLRKNMENDWLSFVQKELANIKFSSSSTENKKQTLDSGNKNNKNEYSKFIPNKIPEAPKLEFTFESNEKIN